MSVGEVLVGRPLEIGIGGDNGSTDGDGADILTISMGRLAPARTDTNWWAGLRVDWVCLIHGRLSFSNHRGNATFPSAAVYFGQDGESFWRGFSPLGPIYRRVST